MHLTNMLRPTSNGYSKTLSYPYKSGSSLNVNFSDLLSLAEQVMDPSRGEVEDLDVLLKQLESKFGAKISVKGYDNNKANIDGIGASTIGPSNVIIAPNILEKMASDPKSRQFYEQKIQAHFDTIPEANAFMAVHGRQIVASGVVIHPDGKVTYYSKSDYTPQEKARLEKAMKEEDEEKARKRAEEKRLDELARLRYWERIHAQMFTVGSPGLETSSLHVHSSLLGPMQLRR